MLLKDADLKLKDNIETKEEDNKVEEKAVKTVTKKTTKKTTVKKEKTDLSEEELKEAIVEWKKQYGKIYKNTIDDNEFVIWRLIKRGEYKSILDNDDLELFNKQEDVVRTALLYPYDAEKLIESRAGLATVLAEEILRHSGFEISESKAL
jgi:hypothetical protein